MCTLKVDGTNPSYDNPHLQNQTSTVNPLGKLQKKCSFNLGISKPGPPPPPWFKEKKLLGHFSLGSVSFGVFGALLSFVIDKNYKKSCQNLSTQNSEIVGAQKKNPTTFGFFGASLRGELKFVRRNKLNL